LPSLSRSSVRQADGHRDDRTLAETRAPARLEHSACGENSFDFVESAREAERGLAHRPDFGMLGAKFL
jgi:hypothetical protein